MFLEECKYFVNKNKMSNFIDEDIDISSDQPDEEVSNEEASDKKVSDKE